MTRRGSTGQGVISGTACEGDGGFWGMVGRSAPMRRVYKQIERFSAFPIPVLILGETGTGKDLAARAIWEISGRGQPFVVVNCAAIPASLIESELFGHEPGAFTGATRRHTGLLAQANGGFLFLDEIAELPLQAQAKLLRAIETGEYRRVGGEKVLHSRFRLIAATHRDLAERVRRGQFRHDLLHRLGAARILIPPLRHRLADLSELISHFLRGFREASGVDRPASISPRALEFLRQAEWTGNLRELKNVIEAAAAVTEGRTVRVRDVREFLRPKRRRPGENRNPLIGPVPLAVSLVRAEREAILEALRLADGDRSAAAEMLGISRATLYRKLCGFNGGHPEAESQI